MSGTIGTTSVPPAVLTPIGYVAPPEQDILVGVLDDLNAAFGGDLTIQDINGNPEERTPQGQLATSETAVIGDANAVLLSVVNGVDPALSTGRMQDGIGRIYFIDRFPALPTVAAVLCNGAPTTVIPAGTLLGALDGNTYIAQSAGTIDITSYATINFQCLTTGPIPCPAGNVSKMMQVIPGWDSASNPSDGIPGQDVETPYQFEARRQLTVAANSNGSIPSVLGSVLTAPNILDAFVTDNPTASPVTIDGVTVPAYALYVCAAGAAPADIAMAIWKKKMPGCPYANGNTTVVVTDPSPNYATSAPTYPVTFQTASVQTLVMVVTLKNSAAVPANAAALIQAAVVNAFNGGDGGPRGKIGQTVYATRFVAPIAMLGNWAYIISIKLGSSATPVATFTGAINGTALTVSGTVTGAVAVGATVIGPNVPDGTRIVSGAGTAWVVAPGVATAIPAEAMMTVTATLDDVPVGQAHIPVLTAPNVTTVLA
jgi:Baseplate J-like protein